MRRQTGVFEDQNRQWCDDDYCTVSADRRLTLITTRPYTTCFKSLKFALT